MFQKWHKIVWTATLALIKVDEIGLKLANFFTCKKYSKQVEFSGKRHIVSVHSSKWLQKRPFSLATPQLDEAIDKSETPL